MKYFILFLFLTSILTNAQEASTNSLQPKSNNITIAGGEGGGGSGGSEGSKITVASSDYDRSMIAHGIECANSIGAILPDKKSIDSIAAALESKITSSKASRSIASEHPQSCQIFSSQTTSVILKRKYIREEISPSSTPEETHNTNSVSK